MLSPLPFNTLSNPEHSRPNHFTQEIKLSPQHPSTQRDSFLFSGRNALHAAAEVDNTTEMQELMEDGVSPDELNEQDENGNTPLHIAAWHGAKNAVRVLLGKPGIDRHLQNNDSQTPAQLATHPGVIRLFNKANGGF